MGTNDGDGNPYFTQEEVAGILAKMDNFWQLSEEDVNAVLAQVNEKFGFDAGAEEEAPAAEEGAARKLLLRKRRAELTTRPRERWRTRSRMRCLRPPQRFRRRLSFS